MPNGAIVKVLRGRRLLVVEDDYLIADELANSLTAADAEVVGPVASVAKARRLISDRAGLDGAIRDVNLGARRCFR